MNMWDALTVENLYGSWEVHYEPIHDRGFDQWLKDQEPEFVTGRDLGDESEQG